MTLKVIPCFECILEYEGFFFFIAAQRLFSYMLEECWGEKRATMTDFVGENISRP